MTNKTQTTKQTAGAAFEAKRSEALAALRKLTEAVTAAGRGKNVDWGNVGDMTEVVKNLRGAGHWAGINEYVER